MQLSNWLHRLFSSRQARHFHRAKLGIAVEQLESRSLLTNTVTGFVFQDDNEDGDQDDGEAPKAGVLVFAENFAGRFEGTTNVLGIFSITVPTAGSYSVGVDLSNGGRLTSPRDLTDTSFTVSTSSFELGGNGDDLIAVASIDVDQDNDSDLVAVVGNKLRLLRNDGDGGFPTSSHSDITLPNAGVAGNVVSGFFNDDNRMDLAVADRTLGKVYVLFQSVNGTFSSSATFNLPSLSFSLTAGRLDGGDRDDLAVTYANGISVILNPSSSGNPIVTLQSSADTNLGGDIEDAVIGDFNNDGFGDIAFVNLTQGVVAITRGNGSGGFTASTAQEATQLDLDFGPRSIAAGDVTGDGILELVIAVDPGVEVERGFMVLSNSLQVLKEEFTGPGPLTIELADLDRDNDDDVILQHGSMATETRFLDISIYRTDPDLTFENIKFAGVSYTDINRTRGFAIADLDSEGGQDIVAVARFEERHLEFYNSVPAINTVINGEVSGIEFGVVLSAPVFTSATTTNVAENTTAVLTVTATDADLPAQSVTFSIIGGADQTKFSITSGGVLTFASAPNFENPTDTGTNNVYNVTVQASDGNGGTTSQEITINITDVNESNPVLDDVAFDVAENSSNGTAVGTLAATDADATKTFSYSITAGNSLGIFQINSTTGAITVANNANLNREAVTSVALTVQVSDGGPGTARTDTATVTINITEIPVLDLLVVRFTSGNSITLVRTEGGNTTPAELRSNLSDPETIADFAESIVFELPETTNNSSVVLSDVGGADGRMRLSGPTFADVIFDITHLTSLTVQGGAMKDAIKMTGRDAAFLASVSFFGGAGDDTLDVTAVSIATFLAGGEGKDTLKGGGGNDTLSGDAGNDALTGGAGADLLSGDIGDDNVDGGDGDNDTISGGVGKDTLKGGNGTGDLLLETIAAPGVVNSNAKLTGSNLTGTLGSDSLSGFEKASLNGGDGADTLDASSAPATLSVTLTGGYGDDLLTGGAANDSLEGGAGNDVLGGGAGLDTLKGGLDNDLLTGSAGVDSLLGEDGVDRVVEAGNFNFTLTDASLTSSGTGGSVDALDSIETAQLTGGSGANTLDASGFHQGSVTLSGGAGKDILIGSASNDSLNGGSDDDQLRGGAGNDSLTGEAGKDTFDGGTDTDRVVEIANVNFTITAAGLTGNGTDTFAADTVSGGSSIEEASLTGGTSGNTLTVNGFAGHVTLAGAGGSDTLTGGANNDSLDGGEGTDVLTLNNVDNIVLTGTTLTGVGNDALSRIEQVRIIVTLAARTSVINASGFSGAITVTGSNGDDDITTGTGNDSIIGGLGHDDLHGGSGLDTIDGGAGNDCLHGDAGNDKLLGSIGNDTIRGGLGEDSIDGGADDDVLLGEEGNDTILGGTGDLAADPAGLRGDDILIGGDGNDSLSGQDGNDTILGGQGTDKLFGGNGNDTLAGEEGKDTLAGDAGTDALFGGPELDSFTAPAAGEKNEDGLFTDLAFFDRRDLLLAACP